MRVLYCYYRYCYIIVIITIVINIFILIFFIINNNNAIIVVVVVSCHYRGLLLAPWLQYRHLLAVTGRQLPRVFVTRSCHNVYCWCGQGKVSGHDVSSDCSFLFLLLLLYIILVQFFFDFVQCLIICLFVSHFCRLSVVLSLLLLLLFCYCIFFYQYPQFIFPTR